MGFTGLQRVGEGDGPGLGRGRAEAVGAEAMVDGRGAGLRDAWWWSGQEEGSPLAPLTLVSPAPSLPPPQVVPHFLYVFSLQLPPGALWEALWACDGSVSFGIAPSVSLLCTRQGTPQWKPFLCECSVWQGASSRVGQAVECFIDTLAEETWDTHVGSRGHVCNI